MGDGRKDESKLGAPLGPGSGLNMATMGLDHLLNQRKPQPGAPALRREIRLPDPGLIAWRKPRPVVQNPHLNAIPQRAQHNLDRTTLTFTLGPCIQRIHNQISQHPL
jgi:hypothetical protein